jgi:para-nitrobenzyl esterase
LRSLIVLAAALIAGVSPKVQAVAHDKSDAAGVIVETTAGRVEGRAGEGLTVFRGLPYASAPVGALRWQPPVPVSAWSAIRPADEPKPQCPQVQEPGTTRALPPMSEDCLYLNIWTPRADAGKRPVMVFIHGGAFMEGGTNREYDGSALARRGGLVFVNLQYRIGTFGFLELGDIGGKEYASSGNLGILDQIEALKWVRANISGFGGDPDNVTIFGESAGAVSVATLLANDEARGLFRRALLESPRAPFTVTRARATRLARQEMAFAGVATVRELHALSWQALMAAQEKLFQARFEDTSFSPVLDGVVIVEPTQAKILSGRGAHIPVVFGTNLEELRFWEAGEGLPLSQFPADKVAAHLQPLLGDRASQVVSLYQHDNPDHSPGMGMLMLLSDLTFRMASVRLAEAQSQHSPTWLYLFSYRGGPFGAGHAAELPFVFGQSAGSESATTQRDREALKNQIQEAWIAFARHSDPNHPGLPGWPRYDVGQRHTMDFDTPSRVVRDPYSRQRRAWNAVPFDGLKPDMDQASGIMTLEGGGKYWHWTEADQ